MVTKGGPNPSLANHCRGWDRGNFETSALLLKRLSWNLSGSGATTLEIAATEQELLEAINKTGIGPQGYGGTVTALDVHVKMLPCHIASLPVAVNIQCHAHCIKEAVI